jgi:hypothetical protein
VEVHWESVRGGIDDQGLHDFSTRVFRQASIIDNRICLEFNEPLGVDKA